MYRPVIFVFLLSLTAGNLYAADIKPGQYDAQLQTPGGPIRFPLLLSSSDGKWSAAISDPLERIEIPMVRVDGDNITLSFPHYDSTIKARLDGDQLVGQYRKRRGKERYGEMKFVARPMSSVPSQDAAFKPYVGKWSVKFSESDDPALGVFSIRKTDNAPWGTFLTTTGDYRFLTIQPPAKPDSVELSVFDGAHAFLFRMQRQEDGTLAGDFWSGNSWHETFAGKLDPKAELPDAFRLSTVLKDVNLNDIKYPDLDGKLTSLGDPKFAGKARLIQVFGSWCPNCHDAALYLSELQNKYGPRGLSIVGLAFEHTGEFDRDVEMVKRYIKRHNTQYPVLLAGLSDKSTATRQFPLIDKVRSYPTTIFVRADGSVRAVYTGFSGPATGEAYKKLRARYEELVKELLTER
jgi:thiol-disulfide isomerase/thioredoxin